MPPLVDEPLVSALVPNYNYGRYVDQAIGSVLTQSWPKVEVVVCDNGSTDDSVERLDRWQREDPRVKVVVRGENAGPAVAVSTAFRHSEGAIVALLDSDDWWMPAKAERLVAAFRRRPDAGFVVHSVAMTDAVGRPMARPRPPRFPRDGWLAPALARGWCGDMGTASSMSARREVALRVFDLPSGMDIAKYDRLFAERCAVVAPVATVDEVLSCYRIHSRAVTAGVRADGGPVIINRLLAFREGLAAERAEFIERVHGVRVDVRRLTALLRAEPELRLALTTGARPSWAEIRSRARGRARAVGWMALTRAPRKPARTVFKAWRLGRYAIARRDWRLRAIRTWGA